MQSESTAQLSPPRDMHKTIRVQVWANVDEGIADLVLYLNTIEGVTTCASCQGTIGEGGPAPYRAQVMADWPKEVEPRLLEEFDITFEGECWGYIHPREGWKAPQLAASGPEVGSLRAFHEIKLAEPAPGWLKPGDVVLLAPKEMGERMLALENLWAGWKLVRESTIGYHPDFTAAVKRLDEMERGR